MENRNPVPELTDEQRAAALDKAKTARRARAKIKRALKDGRLTLNDMLVTKNEIARRMPVRQVLESLPGIGRAKAKKIMAECGVAEGRRVRGLGCRQRAALTEAVAEHERAMAANQRRRGR